MLWTDQPTTSTDQCHRLKEGKRFLLQVCSIFGVTVWLVTLLTVLHVEHQAVSPIQTWVCGMCSAMHQYRQSTRACRHACHAGSLYHTI
jgi:hypothetical protein